MELTIKKCPKCDSKQFHTITTGRAVSTLNFELETEINPNNNKLETISNSIGEDWDFETINKNFEVRCSACNYSLKRYINYVSQ